MGLFDLFTEEIAIDLGTANTLIIHKGKVVIDEPSFIAIDTKTEKTIAVGTQAKLMQGKTHENIKVIRPLQDGVIADFKASEQMIKEFIRKIPKIRGGFLQPALKMVVCIPSGITEVEKRAVIDSCQKVNAKEVKLIYEPMAAAIGVGIDVQKPEGNMIIDIGGGTTEIAVISLGNIVCDNSVKIAGDIFNNDIKFYLREQHNLNIGERTAEKIKIKVGSVIEDLDIDIEDIPVQGRDLVTGKPREIMIGYKEIAKALNKSIERIEDAVMQTLSITPPELAADIYKTGIYLAGGGSLLRGLNERISKKTELPVFIAEDPLRAVVRGTGKALQHIDSYNFLISSK